MSLANKEVSQDRLFADEEQVIETSANLAQPLADRMRPESLDQFVGQKHLIGEGKPLRQAIESGNIHSMVFWGPPGTGKTTLARMIAKYCGAQFLQISAVLGGVKEIRAAIDSAKSASKFNQQTTLLFVDEVHRFNKAQQDAFLPYVEDGTFIFVGATTENPSFELNNALLSRARTYVLKSLEIDDLIGISKSALNEWAAQRGISQVDVSAEQLGRLALAADGDGRRALNLLEIALDLADTNATTVCLPDAALNEVLTGGLRRFDNQGDAFYDQISALHKSVRGSDPDASLYWFVRMIDGGCDPLYIARRVVRMASEDVGNADPRGLQLALNAWDVQERLGSPEGELAIAQAILYLAAAAKSNAVYRAYKEATSWVQQDGTREVPMHIRNAPTKLMKELGHGKHYRYAHDEPDGYAAGVDYFPDGMEPQRFYRPVDRGLEKQISEKLNFLKSLDKSKDIPTND